ncbi:hypothetical protein Pcinc_022069 [Petrolisthes cinctipes]|uniref:Uncharacterized protein n=1 Tax=Petrolisthes cinctipes TaxID=88211 RepID=A0AAE1KHE9_PETCI|nr:hypothetical protein Pcinc_022069 [Petrolisthes cinctipes]
MKIVPSQHANPKRRGGMRAWNYIALVTTQKAGCRSGMKRDGLEGVCIELFHTPYNTRQDTKATPTYNTSRQPTTHPPILHPSTRVRPSFSIPISGKATPKAFLVRAQTRGKGGGEGGMDELWWAEWEEKERGEGRGGGWSGVGICGGGDV